MEVTEDLEDSEVDGLSAQKAPNEWENPDRLMKELLLNETKDPRKIFAQLPITYEELFSQGVKEVTWKKLEDEKEDKEVQAYAHLLNSDEFQLLRCIWKKSRGLG